MYFSASKTLSMSLCAAALLMGCGGSPDENSTEISQPLTTGINSITAMWGANCIDATHNYAGIWSNVTAPFHITALPAPGNIIAGYLADNLPADPHVGCDKNIIINYTCNRDYAGYAYTTPEAKNRRSSSIRCISTLNPIQGVINVISAQYGPPGGRQFSVLHGPNGIADHCNGVSECEGIFEYKLYGDPAPGVDKPLTISYTCSFSGNQYFYTIPAEANHRSYAIDCFNK